MIEIIINQEKQNYLEKDLIINVTSEEVEIALLEDKTLVEFHKDKRGKSLSVGDVYFGTITKLMPGLNACFVNIGQEREAFLHFTDLGVHFRSFKKYTHITKNKAYRNALLKAFRFEEETVKTDKIENLVKSGDQLIIQVEKEPISTKGARVSAEVSIPGRFFVLCPFQDHINVSKNISTAKERKRILRLTESIKPKNFGIIIRTAAENKNAADLIQDLKSLILKWEELSKKLGSLGSKKIKFEKVLEEEIKAKSILRDVLNESFNKIIVNNKEFFHEIRTFTSSIAPGMEKIIAYYDQTKPIFDQYHIRKQLKSCFSPIMNMSGSSYLVTEKTEALYVIDVNSGNKVDSSKSTEENAFIVNKDAAKNIARLLRLRDIGGIIIVDFIDMRNPKNKKDLLNEMQRLMKMDKAKHKILPLSGFGLMQITRQRAKPEIDIQTTEACPACNGKGEISSSLLLIDEIEKNIKLLLSKKKKYADICLYVHPYVASHLKNGLLSKQRSWWFKHNKWITIVPNDRYYLTQYAFYNKKDKITL